MLSLITLAFFKFEINIFSLVSFIAGMASGALLLALYYVLACFKDINKNSIKLNKNIENVSQEQIDETIDKYKEAFEDEKHRRGSVPIDTFKDELWEMMQEIAQSFYPKSKRPLTELSINEMIELDKYIVAKIEQIFSHRGLRLFKALKVSTIVSIVSTSNKVNNNSVVKTVKKYHLKKIYDGIMTVAKALNPLTWFKKLIVNPATNMLIDKLCLLCFSIVGGETYNVYSKQAFVNEEEEIKKVLSDINKNSDLDNEPLDLENKEEVKEKNLSNQEENN